MPRYGVRVDELSVADSYRRLLCERRVSNILKRIRGCTYLCTINKINYWK